VADTLNVCYVYVLFDLNGVPFYIGQGRGNRWLDHERYFQVGKSKKDDLIAQILSQRKEIPKVKIFEGLSNKEAMYIEEQFIRAIGRSPIGSLLNRKSMGPAPHSEEVCRRISEVQRNRKRNPHSAETRAKISKSQKGQKRGPQSPELIEKRRQGILRSYADGRRTSKSGMTGKTHSEETKQKISQSNSGKVRSDQFRLALSLAHSGRKRGPLSSITREKIRAAMKGRIFSEETLLKMSASAKKGWELRRG
jgi:hypothetical protein